jgi:hypothetical protein
LAEAPEVVGGHGTASGVGESDVLAEWRLPDGTTRTGRVEASDGLPVGAKVDIWLDDDGELADRPLTEADATAGGVLVALAGWLSVAGLLAVAQAALHVTLNRRRYREWDRQWARIAPPGWNAGRR